MTKFIKIQDQIINTKYIIHITEDISNFFGSTNTYIIIYMKNPHNYIILNNMNISEIYDIINDNK